MYLFFFLSWPLKLSLVSVVFDFNDSLNDVAPAFPMLLPGYMKRKEKEWFADGCLLCVFFLCFLPLRSISTSVVFSFSDSLNDVAPLAPIVLSVDAL